jgi:hypothetical protein
MSRASSRSLRLMGMAAALALALANPLHAQVDSTSGGSLTIQVNGTEVARFVPNGISSSGVVQVSGTSLSCAAAINGALRYSSTSNTLQICVGSTWTSLSSNTAAAGASAMSGLSDVQLTNTAGRDYLRYDAGTSRWVNISESTVMSTTTMVAGYPDAILCSDGTNNNTLYLTNRTATALIYEATLSNVNSTRYFALYDYPAGTYNSHASLGSYDCVTNAWNLNQLYANGQAFNLIGGASRWQDVAGFTYLTANNVGVGVTVSSSAKFEVNGLVSATSGIIYGGLTVTGAVSGSRVSATNVSASMIQVGAGGSCAASVSGSIRYGAASNTLQICTGTGWVSLSSGTSGVSAISALTDVTLTNLAGRDYLRYDAGTSKWVNISESTVMSTTTMVANWPDAIICTSSGVPWILWSQGYDTGGTTIYYRPIWSNAAYLYFNLGNRQIAGSNALGGSITGCDNGTTVDTLYANGKAFNLIGSNNRWQDVNAFTYLTANNVGVGVTVSSSAKFEVAGLISATGATGAVSTTNLWATTANITTANIPTLTNNSLSGNSAAFNSVSSTLVSATNISVTSIQVGTGGACAASVSGSIRYGAASNTLQICTGTGWVSLSSGTATASTAGATTQVQYNNNGSLGADANFAYVSATGSVSATRVSSTLVSTTYVQLNSATTSILACGSSLIGTMRFTSGTVQVCDGTNWGNVGIGVPTGTIMAFAASSCPTGWSEYTAARGRFLRGIDTTGASVDPNGPRAAGSTQADAMQGHQHSVNYQSGAPYGVASANIAAFSYNAANSGNPVSDGTNGTPRTSSETRPVNVAVMFCRYDGYQSGAFAYTSSTVAGSTGDIQFNTSNALDADTGQLFWDKTNNQLGIGTGSPNTTLNVSGSFNVSLSTQTASNPSLYVNTSGNVGIGTNAPSGRLGVVTSSGNAIAGVSSAGYGLYAESTSSHGLYAISNGSGQMGVRALAPAGGNSIGVYSTGHLGLYAASDNGYYAYIGHYSSYSLYGNGNIWIGGAYQGSDARLKDDIRKMEKQDALDSLMKLRPVSFKWKPDSDQARARNGVQYGLIAQEAQKVLPHIVTESDTPIALEQDKSKLSLNQKLGKVFGVDYTALVPWLLAAVQELKAEFDGRGADVMRIKAVNDNLVSKTAALAAQLEAANDNHLKEIKSLRDEIKALKPAGMR